MTRAAARRPALVDLAVMLATIVYGLDLTIVNVALPELQAGLSASRDSGAWVLTGYMVASATATPMSGWLSARFGRKRLFLAALVGFAVLSAACAVSQSLTQLVALRVLQGAVGAPLFPLSLAILLDAHPPHRHGPAIALWGAGTLIGPTLGSLLGGFLTEWFGWRSIFLPVVPLALATVPLALAVIRETPRDADRRLDLAGLVTLGSAIAALQLLLSRGALLHWFASPEIIVEAVVAAGGLALFVHRSLRHPQPFLRVRLLQDRNLATGLGLTVLNGFTIFATLVLVPPLLQELHGFAAGTIGLLLAARGIGTMAGLLLAGRLVLRLPPRLVLAAGFVLTAVAAVDLVLLAGGGQDAQAAALQAARSGLVQGIGIGFASVPLNALSFVTLPAADRTDGSALLVLLRGFGGSAGIAVVVSLVAAGAASADSYRAAFWVVVAISLLALPLIGLLQPATAAAPAGTAAAGGPRREAGR